MAFFPKLQALNEFSQTSDQSRSFFRPEFARMSILPKKYGAVFEKKCLHTYINTQLFLYFAKFITIITALFIILALVLRNADLHYPILLEIFNFLMKSPASVYKKNIFFMFIK